MERSEMDHRSQKATKSDDTEHDELYQNLAVKDSVIPLYSAHSTKADVITRWHGFEVGAGKVFATTLGHDRRSRLTGFSSPGCTSIAYVTGHMSDDESSKKDHRQRGDHHYQSTVTCNPANIIEAESAVDVQLAVRRAAETKTPLKVVSLKKSNSNTGFICPEQGGILLNLWKMDQVIRLGLTKRPSRYNLVFGPRTCRIIWY